MGRNSVYAYVSAPVRDQFARYRAQCGLSTDAALLGLLVMRELNIRVLAATPHPDQGSDAQSGTGARELRPEKITVNLDLDGVERFHTYAREVALTPSNCARLLAERELTERWLLESLARPPSP